MPYNELGIGQVDIGKLFIQTRYDIIRNSWFDKLSRDRSFTSEACFDHILLRVLKTGVYRSLTQCHYFPVIHCSFIFTPYFNGSIASIYRHLVISLQTTVHNK